MRLGRREARGQALVEFAFGIIIFLTLFIAIIDMGRGIFAYTGVAQAARELSRETSVYPGTDAIGASPETQAVYAAQRGLVPGLQAPTFECVDIAGALQFDTCVPGDWVRVTTSTTFQPSMPLLAGFGPFVFDSVSSAEIQ